VTDWPPSAATALPTLRARRTPRRAPPAPPRVSGATRPPLRRSTATGRRNGSPCRPRWRRGRGDPSRWPCSDRLRGPAHRARWLGPGRRRMRSRRPPSRYAAASLHRCARPILRPPRRPRSGSRVPATRSKVLENAVDHFRLPDQGDHPHRAAAAWECQRVHLVDPTDELGTSAPGADIPGTLQIHDLHLAQRERCVQLLAAVPRTAGSQHGTQVCARSPPVLPERPGQNPRDVRVAPICRPDARQHMIDHNPAGDSRRLS